MQEYTGLYHLIQPRDEKLYQFLKKDKFRGTFASILTEPTEKEVNYVLDQLEKMNQSEKDFFNHNELVYNYISYKTYCSCNEDEEVYYSLAEFNLSDITDVPDHNWGLDERIISVIYCNNCLCWKICE